MFSEPPVDHLTSVLLVGKGSHLARAVFRHQRNDLTFHALSHDEDLASVDFNRYSVVVNMGYDPRYMREPYNESLDFDLEVARRTANSSAHFVMMSTRRVYGSQGPFRLSEASVPSPGDHYGRNKLRTEGAVQELLGGRCTILRIANVFDFEPGRHTFFGIALSSLKANNQVVLDVSPFVRRDFIFIDDFVYALQRVLLCRPAGVLNLGSGHATALGTIALGIIEGYQQGSLLVTSPSERDEFELDISKLTQAIGPIKPSTDVRARCIEIGERLRNA